MLGKTYGRLTVIEKAEPGKHGKSRVVCLCDCGESVVVETNSIKSGNTRSCGCLQKEVAARRCREGVKHGKIMTRVYKTWAHMKARCLNENDGSYKNYGGRGIGVCEEWLEFEPFNEWAMANGYSPRLTIERIDNDGNYEPENCKWADRLTQANNKRNNRVIAFKGEQKTLAEWSRTLGIKYNTLNTRLSCGWSVERALGTPQLKLRRVIRNGQAVGRPYKCALV